MSSPMGSAAGSDYTDVMESSINWSEEARLLMSQGVFTHASGDFMVSASTPNGTRQARQEHAQGSLAESTNNGHGVVGAELGHPVPEAPAARVASVFSNQVPHI